LYDVWYLDFIENLKLCVHAVDVVGLEYILQYVAQVGYTRGSPVGKCLQGARAFVDVVGCHLVDSWLIAGWKLVCSQLLIAG
jgi:hypothetical protein